MGNITEQLTQNNIEQFSQQHQIDPKKTKLMIENFYKLDKGNKGYVKKQELLNALDLSSSEKNFLSDILNQFCQGENNQINLAKLIRNLSYFENDNKQAKLQFLFDLLDEDEDGFLTLQDLERGFQQARLPHLKKEDLKEIALQTLKYADKKQTGNLDFEEFESFFSSTIHLSI